MTLHFINGRESEVEVIAENRTFKTIRANNGLKYRLYKETGEVHSWTNHNILTGLYVTD